MYRVQAEVLEKNQMYEVKAFVRSMRGNIPFAARTLLVYDGHANSHGGQLQVVW